MEYFDYKFYYSYYPDLGKANINTELKLRIHYERYGKGEKRFINKQQLLEFYKFNPEIYRFNQNLLNHKLREVENHFIKIGIPNNYNTETYEVKEIQNKKFDVDIYRENYSDLKKMTINQALIHYIKHGIMEKRIADIRIYDSSNIKLFEEAKYDPEEFRNTNLNYLNLTDRQLQAKFIEEYRPNLQQNEITSSESTICLIFHIGSWEVAKEIYDTYPRFFQQSIIDIYITYRDSSWKGKIKQTFNPTKMILVDNLGMDIGGFMMSMSYMKKEHLIEKYDFYIKIHTKTDKEWREKMITPIYQNLDFFLNQKENLNSPCLYSSKENVGTVFKRINYEDCIDICNLYYSGENFSQKCQDIYYDYYPDYFYTGYRDINKLKKNKFTCLDLNPKFYEKMENLTVDHWSKYGVNEFHRLPNYHIVKDYKKSGFRMVFGTVFVSNRDYIKLLDRIDWDEEYNKLEMGYIINDIPRRTHSWEYFFGLINELNNGEIIDLPSQNNIQLEKRYFEKRSQINVPFLKSKIAFFLLPISGNDKPNSGGYRTLLKYIKYLNQHNYTCDIYLGICWNEEDVKSNTSYLNYWGEPKCNNWFLNELEYYIKGIDNYQEIDLKKNNFYTGFKLQRDYDYVVANAWQTADAVYLQKEKAKKILYIIQDLEYLFYENPEMQKNVINTYQKEYRYYFITKYLSSKFRNDYQVKDYVESTLCVNLKKYFNMNKYRNNSVVIPYYQNIKLGRFPKLVEEIIKILSESKINCYIYPFEYNKTKNEYIHNLGTMNEEELNELYNTNKVGIIFSKTNPSRLGFEMYCSGLNVIELDNEFTKLDMPEEYFTKIKDSNNILEKVNSLFNTKINPDYRNHIDIDQDYKKFMELFS